MKKMNQAEWDAKRAEVKAAAAEVVEAKAVEAKERKDRALKRDSSKATAAFDSSLQAKLAKRASRVKAAPVVEEPTPVVAPAEPPVDPPVDPNE